MVVHWIKQKKIAWRSEAFSKHQTPHLRLEFEQMQERRTDFGIAWTNEGRLFYVGGQMGLNKPTQSVEMLRCCSIVAEPTANGTWTFVALLGKLCRVISSKNSCCQWHCRTWSWVFHLTLRTTDFNISSQSQNIIALLTWGTLTCATFGISAYKNTWNKQRYNYHLLCACFNI